MIETSKIYQFTDEGQNFILRFLDAQKLIEGLVLTHSTDQSGPKKFQFFRDLILSSTHLISYLKHRESLGLFIDSENPFFRFKIELHEVGALRTLILPKDFNHAPNKIDGLARVVKFLPHQSRPYTSHLELKDIATNEVVNHILETSYQVNSTVLVSEKSDSSLLIMKLPSQKTRKNDSPELSLSEYLMKNQKDLLDKIDQNYQSEAEVIQSFESLSSDVTYLYGKEIEFRCSCSKEQMVTGIAGLVKTESLDQVFDGKETLESQCDYCLNTYTITKDEVEKRALSH